LPLVRLLGLGHGLWHHPQTPDRERKRMVRLLIEDVTLVKTRDDLTAHVRFRGGATTSLQLPPALSAWQLRQTSPQVVTLIDQLLDECTPGEIAARLNAQGYTTGAVRPFHRRLVERLCRDYRLTSRYDRLRAQGLLTLQEIARLLDVHPSTVKAWTHQASCAPAHTMTSPNACTNTRASGCPRRCKAAN
jgi:hypothetical protein